MPVQIITPKTHLPQEGDQPKAPKGAKGLQCKPKDTDALRRENKAVRDAAKDAGLSKDQQTQLHKAAQQESQDRGRPLKYNEIRDLVRDLFGK